MKRISPVILTAFSVLALSFPTLSKADNTDSDGFIVFQAQTTDVAQTTSNVAAQSTAATSQTANTATTQTQQTPPAQAVQKAKPKVVKKAVKKVSKRQVRKTRKVRQTRAQRAKRLKRSTYYTVRKGDTLYRISVNSGVKLSRLISLNKLHGTKKHKIQAGQKIRLR